MSSSNPEIIFLSSSIIEEELNLISILNEFRNNSYNHEIRKLIPNTTTSSPSHHDGESRSKTLNLHSLSIFSYINPLYIKKLYEFLDNDLNHISCEISSPIKRCLGSLCGLAIADSIGHNFEFLPVQDHILIQSSYIEYPSSKPGGKIHNPLNQFHLKPGQWTDDTSMALCQADSLLTCGGFNGSHTRCYYWNWWNNNVNNAFRYDDTRCNSCGLGGNISQSLSDVSYRIQSPDFIIPHRFGSFNEDSGNGSLMRLAPIPIRYHKSIEKGRQYAYQSSLTTHPGSIAAEACSFVSFLIIRCIHQSTPLSSISTHSPQPTSLKSSFFTSFLPSSPTTEQPTLSHGNNIQQFLNEVIDEYIQLRDNEEKPPIDGEETQSLGWKSLRRLLIGRDNPSTERCWNWKEDSLDFESTLQARGRRYNGYPVSPGYFGAYSLDGLAMALHAIYHTTSFNMAIVKVVNMCGDADSTGAIAGQIAGAYYGIDEIDRVWLKDLRRWDRDREIELRAFLLYCAGILCDPSESSSTSSIPPIGNENSSAGSVEETKDSQAQQEENTFASFFPAPDTQPVVGLKHPNYIPPSTPSRPFDQPFEVSSKRKLSVFRLFS